MLRHASNGIKSASFFLIALVCAVIYSHRYSYAEDNKKIFPTIEVEVASTLVKAVKILEASGRSLAPYRDVLYSETIGYNKPEDVGVGSPYEKYVTVTFVGATMTENGLTAAYPNFEVVFRKSDGLLVRAQGL
jgi:hypothetical protein